MEAQKPIFDDNAPRAPYQLGAVPRCGWYCIETTFCHATPAPERICRAQGVEIPQGADPLATATAAGLGVEICTPATLQRLADVFAAVDAAGRGLPLTRDHAGVGDKPDTRAAGWVRALHADGSKLWAWIELTPWGYDLINGGEFAYFSTEYPYDEFARVEGGAEPRHLTGVTLTNNPRHTAQTPCTNCKPPQAVACNTNTNTMDTDTNNPAVNEEEEQQNPAAANFDNGEETRAENDETTETAAENSEGAEDTTAANDDTVSGGMTMEDAIVQVAQLLQLPETSSPADFLQAVKNLQESNAQLQAALAEANKAAPVGGAVNHRRFPGLALNHARKPLRGGKPNATVTVRTAVGDVAVNAQQKAKADYCRAAVQRAERSKGGKLTPAEFSATYSRAARDFSTGAR